MKTNENLEFKFSIFKIPILFIVLIWVIYWFEIQFGFNFNKYGLYPKTLLGLKGIITMHFIHSDTNHLFNNSVPLFVLASSLFYFYQEVALKVFIIGSLLSGLLTWFIATEGYHIGASGIVYLLFSFVFFSGILKKHYRLVATSLIVIFLYGSMIWYVLPIKDGMSWEGHLSGFLMGLLLSFIYRKKGINKQEIIYNKTEFDLMFDEEGNFKPINQEENIEKDI